jgi:hypothetical protein
MRLKPRSGFGENYSKRSLIEIAADVARRAVLGNGPPTLLIPPWFVVNQDSRLMFGFCVMNHTNPESIPLSFLRVFTMIGRQSLDGGGMQYQTKRPLPVKLRHNC